jgi:F-type H+-transporting ATPase subunit epsilon
VATLQVELVAVERKIWSGEATTVVARTTEGELGILPGHAPLLGQLADGGVVTIRTESGEDVVVAAHGGFLSISEAGVSILAETAEISTEIDVERAREALRRAEGAGEDDPEAQAATRRAQSRLRAAGESV